MVKAPPELHQEDPLTIREGNFRAAKHALVTHDDGLGVDHAAVDRARLHAHARGLLGDELRFHRFAATASVGCHQAMERELRAAHCAAAGVAMVRRVSAGGALYLDAGQQCFSLIVPKQLLGDSVAERLECGAAMVAAALARLGVNAAFKAPNDLQLAGRQKIGSVFLAEEADSALLFGVILAEVNVAAAMKALLVPTEKLTVTGLEHARERLAALADVLGSAPPFADIQCALRRAVEERLGCTTVDEPLSHVAPMTEAAVLPWQVLEGRFETKDKAEGTTLRLLLELDPEECVAAARFATDGHFAPADALDHLAAALRGQPVAELSAVVNRWLATAAFDGAGFNAHDVARLVERAAAKRGLQRMIGLSAAQASGVMLAGGGDPEAALARASVMLVPYCAKPNWCKWRHTIECVECGLCEVGDAYTLARERNMEVITITNFEHLAETLDKMKMAGVRSYVGMCCGDFFLKRHHAFRTAGMDAVLLDIEGATCYELNEEHLAYAGAFRAEARLDLDAVSKIMAQVPVAAERPCLGDGSPRPGEGRPRSRDAGCQCPVMAKGKA